MNNTIKQESRNYIVTTFSKSKKIKDLHYLISSVFFIDTNIKIDEEYFSKPSNFYQNEQQLIRNLQYFNFNKLTIFIIEIENVETKYKKINDDYCIWKTSTDKFFNSKNLYELLTVSENIHKNTIFIFKDTN
jgi:hypothetical protein